MIEHYPHEGKSLSPATARCSGASRRSRGNPLAEENEGHPWLGGISICFLCASPLYLFVAKQREAAIRTKALSNIRHLGIILYEFDQKYGRFPDATTAAKVKADTGTPLTLGNATSNQLFRQLIAFGDTNERAYHAKIRGSKMPDNLFHDDAHALAPGECGYAYIAGFDSSCDPGTILAVCPLIPGTTLFDPKPFGGKAIILRADNSATPMPIEPSGQVLLGGKDIFDPSRAIWRGKAPDIKWQE